MLRPLVSIRMNVDQYHECGESGLFDPTRRLELLEGEIYELHATDGTSENLSRSNSHAGCISFLTTVLVQTVGDRFTVSAQNTLRLSNETALRPDVMLLKRRDDFYRLTLPSAEDAMLVIDISDGSLDFNRQVKLPLYAMSGVAEVWLVNLREEQIEVFADPANESFSRSQVFTRGATILSQAVNGLSFAVDEILG